MDPPQLRAAPPRQPPGRRSSRPPSRSSTSRRRSTTTCTAGRWRSWPSPRRAGRRATRRRSPRSSARPTACPKLRRAVFHSQLAPYAVTGVTAGAVGPVHEVTLERCADAAGGRRPRPGRRRHRRAALHRPVQRQLDPEPGARHVPGARLLLQPLPGRPARARGRRDDLHAPGRARVPPGPPPVLRRLLRGGAGRDDRPGGDRAALRARYAEDEWYRHLYRTSLRLPRRAPVLHVVLGRARAAAPRRRDLRRRRPARPAGGSASAAPTRCATRWRWPSRSSAATRR